MKQNDAWKTAEKNQTKKQGFEKQYVNFAVPLKNGADEEY